MFRPLKVSKKLQDRTRHAYNPTTTYSAALVRVEAVVKVCFRAVLILSWFLFLAGTASAQGSWSSCASDLDQMRIAVNEANEAAKDARSARRVLYRADQNFFSCAQVPAINDFLCQGCAEQQVAARTAGMRYSASHDMAREALDAVAYAVQSTELSCEFPMAAMIPVLNPDEPTPSPACQSFLRRRQGVPFDALRVVCAGEMAAEECAVCLGEPQ